MIVEELFPVAAGATVGLLVGSLASRRVRLWVTLALSIVFGIAATVVSGEFRVSWDYLLVDIPLVLVSACVVLIATRTLRRQIARS